MSSTDDMPIRKRLQLFIINGILWTCIFGVTDILFSKFTPMTKLLLYVSLFTLVVIYTIQTGDIVKVLLVKKPDTSLIVHQSGKEIVK